MRPISRSIALAPAIFFAVALLAFASLALPRPASAQTACDFAPEVKVKYAPSAAVGVTVHVLVDAKDPNGDAIAALTADLSGLPAGNDAVFTPNGSNTSGELTWTPQAGQTGTYAVTFTASNALSGSVGVTIPVTDTAGAPFVQAPSTVIARSFEPVNFLVYAGDPDGEAIASLTATGFPSGATFTANATNTQGTFNWTPDFTSSGAQVTFTASNTLSGSATTFIQVPQVDRAPIVYVPPSATGTEGSLLTICARAVDPDGDAITSFTASPLPIGAQVEVLPPGEVLTLRWTPAVGQAGTYLLQFIASNALTGISSVTVTILPASGDHPPTVFAPASVSTDTGVPLSVNVTASDPDGDAITSLTAAPLPSGATFAANATNTAGTLDWTPGILQGGTYHVVFTAENALAGSASTTIQVTQRFDALLFTTGGNKSIRLGSNRTVWCVNVEPIGDQFAVTQIDPTSLVLLSPGTGSVSQISAMADKIVLAGDDNHDGVLDMKVCFAKADLRTLFDALNGKQTVTVSLEANLITGSRIHGDLTIDVYTQGGQLAASLSPNPPSGDATLFFTTTAPGRTLVRVFDVNGRLVRTALDESDGAAGPHAVRIDGRGTDGGKLPSGVYFYRIEAAEGVATGRFALLR